MNCKVGSVPLEESSKWPCGVCSKGVGNNSILCTQCKKWVHKRCSKVKGKFGSNINFQCPKCSEPQAAIGTKKDKKSMVLDQNVEFEFVDRFCYLGDMISAGGGAELTSRMRVKCASIKLSPILTLRGAYLIIKGKIYKACVQSVAVYGRETWSMKVENKQRLERAVMMMVRWMCGVTLTNRI